MAEDGAMDISTDLGRFTLGKAANVALLDSDSSSMHRRSPG
ncbi:MAG: hypothetical protein R2839_10290 [Thermomicrobiales bacterium]